MFATLIGKKKKTEIEVARLMVNGTLNACEPIFEEIKGYICECPHFEVEPAIKRNYEDLFMLTVFTCNIARIPNFFPGGQDKRIAQHMIRYAAEGLEMDTKELASKINDCKSLMKRLNHPSKNLVYAMPKALFEYYGLNDCQQAYFRDMNVPNPLFLKEMNLLMSSLVWDWSLIKDEYKIVTQ